MCFLNFFIFQVFHYFGCIDSHAINIIFLHAHLAVVMDSRTGNLADMTVIFHYRSEKEVEGGIL